MSYEYRNWVLSNRGNVWGCRVLFNLHLRIAFCTIYWWISSIFHYFRSICWNRRTETFCSMWHLRRTIIQLWLRVFHMQPTESLKKIDETQEIVRIFRINSWFWNNWSKCCQLSTRYSRQSTEQFLTYDSCTASPVWQCFLPKCLPQSWLMTNRRPYLLCAIFADQHHRCSDLGCSTPPKKHIIITSVNW